MAPPPGYAEYQPTNWSAGGLRRVRGISIAIMILLAIVALGGIVGLATAPSTRDAAREYLAAGDEDAFQDSLSTGLAASVPAGAATIAIIVLSMIWLYRVTANHHTLGRQLRWSPGWAIGGWFLPPLLFVIPLLMLREAWKASDPGTPAGAPTWVNQRESPLPWLWFLSYSVIPVALIVLGVSQFQQALESDLSTVAERLIDDFELQILQGLVGIASAVLWGLLVWSLAKRHMTLTGELAAASR